MQSNFKKIVMLSILLFLNPAATFSLSVALWNRNPRGFIRTLTVMHTKRFGESDEFRMKDFLLRSGWFIYLWIGLRHWHVGSIRALAPWIIHDQREFRLCAAWSCCMRTEKPQRFTAKSVVPRPANRQRTSLACLPVCPVCHIIYI